MKKMANITNNFSYEASFVCCEKCRFLGENHGGILHFQSRKSICSRAQFLKLILAITVVREEININEMAV